ncbi:hypothetical protein ZTR_09621 [Talaromyces verruculosus]|nr:hypothetical protein ZTR_09621 [Talaromyces verruculosus]
MLFAIVLLVVCLADIRVAGLKSGDGVLEIREPHPTTHFQIYDAPVEIRPSIRRALDNTNELHSIHLALAYLQNSHGIQPENVRVTDAYTNKDTGVSHIYVRQTSDGLDLLNSLTNVNIDDHGRVISSSHAFAPIHELRKIVRSCRRSLTTRSDQYASLKSALKTLSEHLNAEIDDDALQSMRISMLSSDEAHAPTLVIENIPMTLAEDGAATAQPSIMRRSDGSLAHVWDITLRQANHRWNARINTTTGGIELLVDQMLRVVGRGSDAKPAKSSTGSTLQKRLSYQVVPIMKQDPRDGFDFVVNPETASSPNGWVYSTNTSGNNALAFKGAQTNVAVETSPDTFRYYHEETESPATPQNVGVAITNAFYVVNSLHDILYIYGFNEATFNFQDDNFGRGGQGNDRVIISVQDNHDMNNLDFYTPPDGQNGMMRLFLYNLTNPDRDSALEDDIITSLYAQGMANRLTGGGSGACLQSKSIVGLADFTLGTYVENNQGGIRSHPYSWDESVNPLTYADGPPSAEETHIGEVWANMLHNVLASLVDNHGWSNTALTDSSGTLGNVVYMHLLVDGLSIQPCEPTFVTARDAIIQADQNRYNGDHFCILWRAFASRGLGFGAAEDYVNEYSVPPSC